MKTEHTRRADIVTWILRLIVGGVFIFSGFSKAVDPWGTLYKVEDYLGVMSLDIWPNLVLTGVFALCAVEFMTGVFLLTGSFRRSAAVSAAVIMAFMLPLSLWIAVSDPVADCGCFGDALIISNWATFWKNVAMSCGIIWLLRYNRRSFCLVTPALQWIAFICTGLFVVIIEMWGYNSQPLFDFRPYKVGERLIEETANSGEPHFVFIYEKDGERQEFGENDVLPEESEGWTFVDRKETAGNTGETVAAKNLRIWSKDGEDDETDSAISDTGKELMIMIPDLREISPATIWKLNSLYEWSLKNGITMVAVVSGNETEISDWEDLSMASYPIYTADDTQIKEVVRGNPGVIYLENGIVEWKSTLNAIDIDDFLQPGSTYDPGTFASDNHRILRNIVYFYFVLMGVLAVLSLTPRLHNAFTPARRRLPARTDGAGKQTEDSPDDTVTHDDKAHP